MQSTVTSKAMRAAYSPLTNRKRSPKVKQETQMRDIGVTILTDSELTLISLLASRLARASKSNHLKKKKKITPTDIFTPCGSRKTTACTENKFSNCFPFLLLHWLRHNPAASHSSSLQLSCFSLLIAHFLLTTAATISMLWQWSCRLWFGMLQSWSYATVLSSLWWLIKNEKFCSLSHFVGVINLYLYFASTTRVVWNVDATSKSYSKRHTQCHCPSSI